MTVFWNPGCAFVRFRYQLTPQVAALEIYNYLIIDFISISDWNLLSRQWLHIMSSSFKMGL
ncbi:hypothetical protein ZOSMA_185G00200 [Zostera marina]|uniref:Uncharacterized protein n=1 Tax=Zostera marina TaxID=29655 RepID=A0A0K9PQG4_ZOSMR|nr:hypothetical protein ZOSMA_185G00200 [Zostera marina]